MSDDCIYYYKKAFESMERDPSTAFHYFCMYEYCKSHKKKRKQKRWWE